MCAQPQLDAAPRSKEECAGDREEESSSGCPAQTLIVISGGIRMGLAGRSGTARWVFVITWRGLRGPSLVFPLVAEHICSRKWAVLLFVFPLVAEQICSRRWAVRAGPEAEQGAQTPRFVQLCRPQRHCVEGPCNFCVNEAVRRPTVQLAVRRRGRRVAHALHSAAHSLRRVMKVEPGLCLQEAAF